MTGERFRSTTVGLRGKVRPDHHSEASDTNTIVTRQASAGETTTQPVFPGYLSEIALPLTVKDKFRGALYLAKKTGCYSRIRSTSSIFW